MNGEDPHELRRLHAIVSGRVQGVNFRYSACERAQKLGLVGWVRNGWDDTVEVVAEGPADALRRLEAWLHVGPGAARVTKVQVTWQVPTGEFHEFEVRF